VEGGEARNPLSSVISQKMIFGAKLPHPIPRRLQKEGFPSVDAEKLYFVLFQSDLTERREHNMTVGADAARGERYLLKWVVQPCPGLSLRFCFIVFTKQVFYDINDVSRRKASQPGVSSTEFQTSGLCMVQLLRLVCHDIRDISDYKTRITCIPYSRENIFPSERKGGS
jgi:hypothetical protein